VQTADDAVVVARGLVKRFGEFVAVDGIDVEIHRGEVFGFLGPNGAGKTSTMRMIACMSPKTEGYLRVRGLDPEHDGSLIRAGLGVVPQEDALDGELTVLENLVVYGRYFDIPRKDARARAEQLLEFAQLSDRAKTKVEELSGGMKRRLTLARALISSPEIVILDEPTTGLDPQARHLVWERLYRLKRDGVTLILTTHYMDEAEQLCDRLVVMDHGAIVGSGTPRSLIEKHVSKEVVEIRLGDENYAQLVHDLADRVERTELLADRLCCYTEDGESLLGYIKSLGYSPSSELVRRASLEDVFLLLTGRSLIE
jgi:lipooligosaccharide transport system ATP-binding protein